MDWLADKAKKEPKKLHYVDLLKWAAPVWFDKSTIGAVGVYCCVSLLLLTFYVACV